MGKKQRSSENLFSDDLLFMGLTFGSNAETFAKFPKIP